MERLEFQLNEYAQLETTLRARIRRGGSQRRRGGRAHPLAVPGEGGRPDTPPTNSSRRSAGSSRAAAPGLITIRGPERMLALLRERVADLPAEIEFVEDGGVEATVECKATRITTELKPWADLLASLDA